MKTKKYIITSSTLDVQNILTISVSAESRNDYISFKPGQYMMISYVRDGKVQKYHSFSVASSPTSKGITFGIKVSGNFTQGLASLPLGSTILIRGPFGSFVPKNGDNKDHIYLAAGIGITPFVSMMRYAHDTHQPYNIGLLYSIKSADTIAFFDESQQLTKENERIHALYTITSQGEPTPPNFATGRISAEHIASMLTSPVKETQFFICGPGPFIQATKKILKKMGAKNSYIHDESFVPSPWDILSQPVTLTAGAATMAASILLFATIAQGNSMAKTTASANALDSIIYTAQINESVNNTRNTVLANQYEAVQVPKTRAVQTQTQQQKIVTTPIQTPVATTPKPVVQQPVSTPKVTTPAPIVTKPVPKVTPTPPPPRTAVS